METVTVAVCALCLKSANFSKSELPQEILMMLEMLNVPNLNLSEVEDPTICSFCVEKVKGAFDFKTACIEAENKRISKAIQIRDKLCESLVECRLCNHCVSRNSAVLLSERLKESNIMTAFQKYIWEINLDATDNPVICKPCQMLLSDFGNFVLLLSHIDSQDEETKDVFQLLNMEDPTQLESDIFNVTKDELKSTESSVFYEEVNKSGVVEVKTEISEESENNTKVVKIKEDCISEDVCYITQIKTEPYSDIAVNEHTIIGIKVDNEALIENDNTDNGKEILHADTKKTLSNEYTQCQLKQEEIDIKSEPDQGMSERNNATEIVEQNTFNYLILNKGTNANEEKTHKCHQCGYHTKLKMNLKRHILIHTNSDEIEMYKCQKCHYQTKFKQYLKGHMINHKNSDEVTMYKCHRCSYRTKFKQHLKGHMLIHKNPDEVEMHKCDQCNYQTKSKQHLKDHMIIHRNSNEIEMHKCSQCSHQTKFKRNLKGHMLTHKNSNEIEMYKCQKCPYQTKFKGDIKKHLISHKNSDEIEMHKCQKCAYETKFPRNLQRHILIHKNSDEIEMHKCQKCHYQSKFKQYLKGHMVNHKNSDEVTMYECQKCTYQTKFNSNLKRHLISHKN